MIIISWHKIVMSNKFHTGDSKPVIKKTDRLYLYIPSL